MIARNKSEYAELLRAIAALSRLFSDNDSPYIDSRFVERLFASTTGGRDIGRSDCSFDVVFDSGVAVGIKTFLAGQGNFKVEKIAEFNSLARKGHFDVTDRQTLAYRVAKARNDRVKSDVAEFGIQLDTSIYHCLVRFPQGACVHEEPYRLIDLDELRPTDRSGLPLKGWSDPSKGLYFTDGKSFYSFNRSKSVLMKRFSFNRKREAIELPIHPRPLELLLGRASGVTSRRLHEIRLDRGDRAAGLQTPLPGKDFVVLPLYSTRSGEVEAKSGINQWNAGGRPRKFGEAYIPIPQEIHRLFPKFFPPRDQLFDLFLPNSKTKHSAKICQDRSKALMVNPNFELGRWIISVLDPSISDSAFNQPVGKHKHFTYADLEKIGKDSVRIFRYSSEGKHQFRVEFAPLGSYEDFVTQLKKPGAPPS